MEQTPDFGATWNPVEKVFFRFLFIFFGLFIIINQYGFIPLLEFGTKYCDDALHIIIPWIGKNILHLPYEITVFTNGSADTTYDYVILLTIFFISLLGMIIWSFLDQKNSAYHNLYYWLTLAIRFYIGLMLIEYGIDKLVKTQFPSPGVYRLTQQYGDSSPMGLAWTFFGFSKGYNFFLGIAEITAMLLLFRRTVAIGAIITLGVTANIMAVNYFYDVPVKIFSTTLFLMTVFLLAKDANRLMKLFLKGEAIKLSPIPAPKISKRWVQISRHTIKYLCIAYIIIDTSYKAYEKNRLYGDHAPKPKIYGFYDVNYFVVGNDTLAPLTTDTSRWRNLIIGRTIARVRYMNDSLFVFNIKLDTALHRVHLTGQLDSMNRCTFWYKSPDRNRLVLKGIINDDSVNIGLTKVDESKFRLVNRGFHWVSEYPYSW